MTYKGVSDTNCGTAKAANAHSSVKTDCKTKVYAAGKDEKLIKISISVFRSLKLVS